MKVIVDTNIIIDALQSRDGFSRDAKEVILCVPDFGGCVTANSVTDIYYLQHQYFHDRETTKENLIEVLRLFTILDTTAEDCRNALRSNIADFEDAVMVEAAMREGIDVIVTRNKKDFKGSPVKVCTPREFLRMMET